MSDLQSAQTLILSFPSSSMVFDDPKTSSEYLDAVDVLLARHVPPSPDSALHVALSRLEDELRHLLQSRPLDVDLDSQIDLNSLSIHSDDVADDAVDVSGNDAATEEPLVLAAEESFAGRRSRRSYGSTRSMREVELFAPETVGDLRSIAERMVAAGYARDCVQVFAAARKAAVDRSFQNLGVERLSIGDVQRIEWDVLEAKIRRWIRAARICIRIVFASERSLCESVFEGINGVSDGGGVAEDGPFVEIVKGPAIHLFGFADAISIGRRSPEKLFKMIDLHDAISDLMPDIASVFRSKSAESIYTQVAEILSRLAEAIRGILSEFENAVLRDPSRTPVPGGTIHPLTRYVMNYISLISDYKGTLTELIVTRPSVGSRVSGEDSGSAGALLPDIDIPELENRSPLAAHLIWIIAVLQHNLESKANLYKDVALCHIFLMNNVHYIVNKVKGLPELREMIGDDYLRRLTGKFRLSATSYQRASWAKVLHCLRDEGIHVSGSFSSGVSKSVLRERFKSFNAAFDEVHRTQSVWSVPDQQLAEELRISISEKLLPAYRSFLGRFRQHIESGRHPEMYIKYSVEDLETALSDFFEGAPPPLNRRRSH